jgi:predicted double-glycine peptidase
VAKRLALFILALMVCLASGGMRAAVTCEKANQAPGGGSGEAVAIQDVVTVRLQDMQPFVYEDTVAGPPPRMCGPKALRLICEHFGIKADVEELAKLAETDSTGTSLYGLKRAAESKGLRAIGMQVGWSCLERMRKPVIAWVGHDHYVVVNAVRDGKAEIEDPDRGKLNVRMLEFAKGWDGYVLVVNPPLKSRMAKELTEGK